MKSFLYIALSALLAVGSTASPVAASYSVAPSSTSTSTSSGGGAPTFTPLTPAEIKSLQTELLLAPSRKDKEEILFPPGNGGSANNVSFQFVNSPGVPPQGGSVIVGSVDSIPGLIGTNLGAAVGFIEACSLNVPHFHRANEFLTVVQGTLIGAFLLEVDAQFAGDIPQVAMTLVNFTGMLFPEGHTHWQFNPTCEPAVFAAAFDSSDEGRFQVAQTFFSSMPDNVLTTSLGNPSFLGPDQIDELRGLIPTAFVVMVESCAQACGIQTKK